MSAQNDIIIHHCASENVTARSVNGERPAQTPAVSYYDLFRSGSMISMLCSAPSPTGRASIAKRSEKVRL